MISAAVGGRRWRRGREKVISLVMEVCKRKTQNTTRESMLRIFGGYMKEKDSKERKKHALGGGRDCRLQRYNICTRRGFGEG